MDKRKRDKKPKQFDAEKNIIAASDKGTYYNQDEWLWEYLCLGLYNEETENIENWFKDSENEETCYEFSETESSDSDISIFQGNDSANNNENSKKTLADYEAYCIISVSFQGKK